MKAWLKAINKSIDQDTSEWKQPRQSLPLKEVVFQKRITQSAPLFSSICCQDLKYYFSSTQ